MEKEHKMTVRASNFCSQISFMHEAIMEQLRKADLTKYLGEDVNFNSMVCYLVRKYLSNYRDDNLKYDIVLNAYTHVFLKNLHNLKKFDGTYPIERYINTLMSRAIINASQEALKELRNRQELNTFEDETMEEALDRVRTTRKHGSITKCDFEEAQYYADLIKQYNERVQKIKKGEIQVPDASKSVKRLQEKIKELAKEYKKAKGFVEKCILHDIDEAHKEFTVEEEMTYESIVEAIRKKIKNRRNYEAILKTFDMLIAGFTPSEIRELLDAKQQTIHKRINIIKDIIKELAEEQDFFDGDSDLLNTLKTYSNVTTIQDSKTRLPASKGYLYKQINKVFGVAFIKEAMELVGDE